MQPLRGNDRNRTTNTNGLVAVGDNIKTKIDCIYGVPT